MYYRQQNRWYPAKGVKVITFIAAMNVMKFDRSNKFVLWYYGQVNSLRLKSNLDSKWASKHLWGNIYFAGNGSYIKTLKMM